MPPRRHFLRRAVPVPDEPVAATPSLLSLVDTSDPDVVHEFVEEGASLYFGRDDGCDVVVPPAGDGPTLSARAGCVWRMSGELWIRNLSTAHDLYLQVPGQPPEPPLPARRDGERGPARSIPAELAYLRGPGGCELLIRQLHPLSEDDGSSGETVRLPPVPDRLAMVAAALCEPLLDGHQLPASYRQVGERTAMASRKAVRNQVDQLVELYCSQVPLLAERIERRVEREARQLGLPQPPRLSRGVWLFDRAAEDAEDVAELERRTALALPDYYEVAHLLVRRRLVTRRHVERLPAPE